MVGLPGAALGDPQLKGFLGQSFQVHGLDGGVYSVLSEKEVQVNARFTFLEGGRCPPKIETPCWSTLALTLALCPLVLHPAPLCSSSRRRQQRLRSRRARRQVALIRQAQHQLLLRLVYRRPYHERMARGGDRRPVHMQLDNSDSFINLVSVRVSDWSKLVHEVQPHGLAGSDVKRQRLGLDVKEVEGRIDDYLEANNDMMGNEFMYNKFEQ